MPFFEIYKDRVGTYRWRLKAANGEIVAVGEGYSSLSAAENSALHLKRWASTARITFI